MFCCGKDIASGADVRTEWGPLGEKDGDKGLMDKRSRVGWRGYLPAITTPFDANLDLDLKGLGGLLEWLHAEGMHGLVIAGTTGEWFSLKPAERRQLFDAVGAQLGGKLPIIAGCTAFSPQDVIEHSQHAKTAGFEGILVTPPPYAMPNDEELFQFYAAVSAGSALPVCVYNWPPGTNIDMPVALLARIADLDNIVAIKQSSGRLDRFVETFFALKDKVRVFGIPMNDLGITLVQAHDADGTMGAGGVLGRFQSGFYDHLWRGEVDAARACGAKDRVLMAEWFTPQLTGKFGSGAAILKAALNAQGVPGGRTRPPFIDVNEADVERIRQTLVSLGRIDPAEPAALRKAS
jgi:dihydrodipicolinate synthase/N-acetylneuraminate lyase